MSIADRGVIEGFYDRLWTWDERARVAETVAGFGFTTYVYAPKEDRHQNALWRSWYPADERRNLAAFTERCRAMGLMPWIGLRPVGISYADDGDADRVVERLRASLELGATGVLLLADDIPESLDAVSAGRFTDLADAHAWLIDRVLGRLDGAQLAFCPTEYHGSGGPYLHRLAPRVPAEVGLCWTGPRVCSPRITAGEAAGIGAVLGRRPIVWDNYPVNDAVMTDELHIGAIRDRDPALAEHVAAIWVNPAMEPEATLVPLAAWGEYLADPDGYDADAAWERALLRVSGNADDAAAVAALAAHADRSVIRQPWRLPAGAPVPAAARRATSIANERLAADLARFVSALPGGPA